MSNEELTIQAHHQELLTTSEQLSHMMLDVIRNRGYAIDNIVALLSMTCVNTLTEYHFSKKDYKPGTFWFLKARFLQAIENGINEGEAFVNATEEGVCDE